jgi:hypothetical protein
MKYYYLAKVEMVYAAKNKLYEAIQHYLKNLNRRLIQEKDISASINTIIANILRLNGKFPRCGQVTPSFWKTNEGDEMISFGMDSIIVFGFYKGYLRD